MSDHFNVLPTEGAGCGKYDVESVSASDSIITTFLYVLTSCAVTAVGIACLIFIFKHI